MLSESVCRACHLKEDPKNGAFLWDVGMTPINGHESFVERGRVGCPSLYTHSETVRVAVVKEPPPHWCPYKFEHAVAFSSSSQ